MEPSLVESIGRHLPRNWEPMHSLEVFCCDLSAHSHEYTVVEKNFRRKFDVVPKRIVRVQSAHLYAMYLLKKAELGEDIEEKDLWHATSEGSFVNIIKTNLDWRRANRVRFGRGVSFSPSARYANERCNQEIPKQRVCIRCKVLVGRVTPGDSETTLPPTGYDSTGNTAVTVKYADNEFFPAYAVYYDSPPVVYHHWRR